MTYAVKIQPSGYTLYVEEGESVLEAALRQDYDFPYSCRSATCTTCLGKVLKGSVTYGNFEPYALDDAEQEQGLALFCTAQPTSNLVIEVDDVFGPEYIPPRILECKVKTMTMLNANIYQLILIPTDEKVLNYRAGQYLHVLCKDGFPVPLSIANAPIENSHDIELHIRHANHEHVQEILKHATQSETLNIKAPYGKVIYHKEPQLPFIFVAGGTGFVPLKAIIEASLMNPDDQREIYIYWGVQQTEDLYLNELAQRWADNVPRLHYIPVVEQTDNQWSGRTGLAHQAVLTDHSDLSGFQVYASGPKDMVFTCRDTFIQQGLKPHNIFSDTFELFDS